MIPDAAPLRIVHTESSWGWGGQELRILTEAAGMIRRGHDVRIVCPGHAPIFQQAVRRKIPVTALPIVRRNWQALRALRAWLLEHDPMVLNTHSSTDSWLSAIVTRVLRPKLPIVRTRHISTPIVRGAVSRWLYSRGADRVVTTGERLRQTLIDENRVPAAHVVSVPTGVDTNLFVPSDRGALRRALDLPTQCVVIGIAATIRTWKGHGFLIDAVHRLDRRDVLLLIVGAGPIEDQVQQQVARLNMQDRVRMVGQQDNVVPWLQAMDIFALPSYANEGVPQGIVQAMSCQLPVVSTPIGAIEEAVLDRQTGLLVPPRDSEALAGALRLLVEDPALRESLGRRGRERAVREFGIERMLDRMEQVFRGVVRLPGAPFRKAA